MAAYKSWLRDFLRDTEPSKVVERFERRARNRAIDKSNIDILRRPHLSYYQRRAREGRNVNKSVAASAAVAVTKKVVAVVEAVKQIRAPKWRAAIQRVRKAGMLAPKVSQAIKSLDSIRAAPQFEPARIAVRKLFANTKKRMGAARKIARFVKKRYRKKKAVYAAPEPVGLDDVAEMGAAEEGGGHIVRAAFSGNKIAAAAAGAAADNRQIQADLISELLTPGAGYKRNKLNFNTSEVDSV